MKCPVQPALVQRWQTDPLGVKLAHRWVRFLPMFQDHARACAEQAGMAVSVNELAVGRAFFEWQRMVEQSQEIAAVNPLDHAHYVCGRLLRCLLREHPLEVKAGASAAAETQGHSMAQQWPEGHVLLGFVCTLLQSLRLAQQAGDLPWNEELFERHWHSFRENVTEDADSAGPFLDFFMGKEPIWQYPATPELRPAMQGRER